MRRPSSQVSQWRRRRSSYARAEEGLPASARRLRVAGVVGAAVREDLGDHEQALRVDPLEGVDAPVASEVSLRGSPPARSSAHTCEEPSRAERKAIRVPSGLHRGRESEAGWDVIRRGSPPATGTSHRSVLRLPPARSTSVRAKATREPSGETWGSARRPSFIISVAVKGVAAGLAAGARQARPRASVAGKRGLMGNLRGVGRDRRAVDLQATVRFMKAAVEGQPVRNSHDSRMAAGASSRGQSAKACRAK